MITYICTNADCNFQSTDASEFCLDCGSPLVANTVIPDLPPENVEIEQIQAYENKPEAKAGLMNSLIRKVKGIGQTNDDNKLYAEPINESQDESVANFDDFQEVLPPIEEEKGWIIQGDPISTGAKGYDQWLMKTTSSGGAIATFRRYKPSALTNKAAYDVALAAAPTKGVITKLFSYGTAPSGGGTRADYEITSLCNGESLHSWLKKSEPGVDKARFLAPLLVNFLNGLHDLGLRPMTLSPDILSISANKDYLTLNMLGALQLTSETGTNYCAGLSNSALLALPYAAPELIERQVIHNNTETFAIGQILTAAVFGEAQDYAYIRNGSVQFKLVGDKQVEAILMGTLWSDPEGRWSIKELNAAIKPDTTDFPECPPWESLRPGAASAAHTLGGKNYFLPEDLADGIAKNWNEASLQLEEILRWLEDTRYRGAIALLRQQQILNGRSHDWILVNLRRLIAPEAPLIWREIPFYDEDAEISLIRLAQNALNGEEGATATMEELLAADLRGAFTTTPNK